MAATLIAWSVGADRDQIASAASTFAPVEHRLEFVRTINGVGYYNDSKATSVDATLKAIGAFDGGLWIILGGKDKDSDYTVLREPLRTKARAALLIGAAAPKIARQLGDAVPIIPVWYFGCRQSTKPRARPRPAIRSCWRRPALELRSVR